MSLSLPSRNSEIIAPKSSTPVPYKSDNSSSANESRRKMKVAFLICNEVLVEVLSYFDRRQLAKLERACRRFHRIVVRYFNEAPLLFFEMECYVREESRRFSKILSSTDTDDEIGQFQHLLVTGISLRKLDRHDDKTRTFFMSYVNFGEIPPFVCIKSVYIRQFRPAIAQHLFPLLEQFSGNYIDALKFHLDASIDLHEHGKFLHSFRDNDRSLDELFSNRMEFVSCLRKMLEIIKQCSPQFTFCVNERNHQQIDSLSLPLIGFILELSSVQASENVHFLFPTHFFMPSMFNGYCSWTWNNQHSYQNRVKVISDWLHRPYVSGGNHRSEYVRSLTIGSTEREHMLMNISRKSIEQLIEDLKVRFPCSHCQPYCLKLVLREEFQFVANETLENRETNEQMNIQNQLVSVPAQAFVNGQAFDYTDRYTEITVTRTRHQLPNMK